MKKLIVALLSYFALLVIALPAGQAQAWSLFPNSVCDKGKNAHSPTCIQARGQSADENPVAKLIGQAASLIALIAGLVAVIMIIVAGFQMVTSAGNSDAVSKARGRILGAIVGLIIIAFAWTIITLVTDKVIN